MAGTSKGLGKGLSALMADDYSQQPAAEGDRVTTLPLSDLTSGKYQPRHYFDNDALKELAESIRSNGVMQPILVRKLDEPKQGATYEIIAGERRWRASKIAGLTEVPVLIKNIDDKKALEMALIENIQRQDLNALEEADGYQQLMDGFGYTQEELSLVVGKSRSYIANMLRLQALPETVKNFLSNGEISAGHARALLKASEPEKLVHEIVRRGLNVRQTENLVKAGGLPVKPESQEELDSIEEFIELDTIVQRNSQQLPSEHLETQEKADITKEVSFQATASPVAKSTQPSSVQHKKASSSSAYIEKNFNKDPDIIALEEALEEHLGLKVVIDDQGERGSVTLFYASLTQLDNILKRIGSPV